MLQSDSTVPSVEQKGQLQPPTQAQQSSPRVKFSPKLRLKTLPIPPRWEKGLGGQAPHQLL